MELKIIKHVQEIKDNYENALIHGDCLTIMEHLPANTYSMVFIDPPYFLQLPKKQLKRWKSNTQVSGVEEHWDQFASFEEYDKFVVEVLNKVKRLMKDNATIWVIGTYHSLYRWGKIMQDMGFWILNDVIWLKSNPMPNWLGVRFTNATETLIWATKNKTAKDYIFNKEQAKVFGIGKVYENVWKIPICSGSERVKDEQGQKVHPTQKPIELLKRVILTSTKENDLILDPMTGIGTTGVSAYLLGRKFTIIEREDKYVKWIEKRFKDLKDLNDGIYNNKY